MVEQEEEQPAITSPLLPIRRRRRRRRADDDSISLRDYYDDYDTSASFVALLVFATVASVFGTGPIDTAMMILLKNVVSMLLGWSFFFGTTYLVVGLLVYSTKRTTTTTRKEGIISSSSNVDVVSGDDGATALPILKAIAQEKQQPQQQEVGEAEKEDISSTGSNNNMVPRRKFKEPKTKTYANDEDILMDLPWAFVFAYLSGQDIAKALMASKKHSPWGSPYEHHKKDDGDGDGDSDDDDYDQQQQIVPSFHSRLLATKAGRDLLERYYSSKNDKDAASQLLPKLIHCLDNRQHLRFDGLYCEKDSIFRGYVRFYPDGVVLGVRSVGSPKQVWEYLRKREDVAVGTKEPTTAAAEVDEDGVGNDEEVSVDPLKERGGGRGTYESKLIHQINNNNNNQKLMIKVEFNITIDMLGTFHCTGLLKPNGFMSLEYTSDRMHPSIRREEYEFVQINDEEEYKKTSK